MSSLRLKSGLFPCSPCQDVKRTAPGHEYLNGESETALMEASFMISIWENTDESNSMHRNGDSLHGFFRISCHFSISTSWIFIKSHNISHHPRYNQHIISNDKLYYFAKHFFSKYSPCSKKRQWNICKKQELVNNSNLSRKSNKFPLISELLNFFCQLLRRRQTNKEEWEETRILASRFTFSPMQLLSSLISVLVVKTGFKLVTKNICSN